MGCVASLTLNFLVGRFTFWLIYQPDIHIVVKGTTVLIFLRFITCTAFKKVRLFRIPARAVTSLRNLIIGIIELLEQKCSDRSMGM